jgi:hypothetical protein
MKTIKTVMDEIIEVTNDLVYVTATDKFMSGWGMARNKTAKRVIVCQTWRQAQRMENAIKNCPNSGMTYVNITSKFPYYNPNRYITSWCTYADFNNDAWMKYTNIPDEED